MEISAALAAIAPYLRSVTARQVSEDEAKAELTAIALEWEDLRARIVSSTEDYDESRHFDVLLTDGAGTYTISFAAADGLPWPLRGVNRWSEEDLVRVNGTTLTVQQAVSCLDFIWERDDLMNHLVNVCLVEEELAARRPFSVRGQDLQDRLDEFRRAHGLFSAGDTHKWLAGQGISHRQLERRLEDKQRVELLAEHVIGDLVPDYVKAHQAELGSLPVILATARSPEDLEELHGLTCDPAAWLNWAIAVGGSRREVRCCRISAFDSPPAMSFLASDDVPVGTVSDVYPHRLGHALACKIGPTELPEASRELTRRVRDRLFAEWLAERRRVADVEWYWGPAG